VTLFLGSQNLGNWHSYRKTAKAYDWNQLVKDQIIHDTLEKSNIVVVLENDKKAMHSKVKVRLVH
jgi:hypothetical protein